jgi:tRNA dimethylallyltransferase
MIDLGALDEVAALTARGLAPDLPVMKAVGLRELRAHLAGDLTLAEAVAAAQRASRQYAKRQYTWFRHQLAADLRLDTKFSINLTQEICQKIRNWA